MKKYNLFTILVLTLSMMMNSVMPLLSVQAQDVADEISVDVNVFLSLAGESPQAQSQISYDIIQPNPAGGDGTVIYSYRSENPPAEALKLAPGDYRFRLFDGGQFYRNEQAIQPLKFTQTIANLTEDDLANNRHERSLDVGQINEWADGTRVYDVPFSLALGDNIYNSATGEYEVSLNFTLGDQALTEETPTPDSGSEESVDTTTAELKVSIVDEANLPVANVSVFVNGINYVTNESGQVHVTDLEAGQAAILEIVNPEGYTGSNGAQEILMEANTIVEVSQQLAAVSVEESLFDASINIVDNNGNLVPNVVVEVNGITTNTAEGTAAVFNNLAVGEYTYNILELPQAYTTDSLTGQFTVDGVNPTSVDHQVKLAPTQANVRFIITNEDTTPLPNVLIHVNEQSQRTNEAGEAVFESLPPATYDYQVTEGPEGYVYPLAGNFTLDNEAGLELPLTLEKVVEYGNVNLKVVDEVGNPIAGAELELREQAFVTNENGEAIILDLPAGETFTYKVLSLPAAYANAVNLPEGNITIVANEETAATITISSAKGQAEIKVTNENAEALSEVSIILNEQEGVTDGAGVASFTNIPVGTHTYQITSVPETYLGDVSGEITINAGETTQATVELAKEVKYGNLRFIAQDQDGNLINGITITLADRDFQANAQGEVIIQDLVAEKEYNFQISGLAENMSVDPSQQLSVQVLADVTTDVVIPVIRQAQKGALAITILDQFEQAVVGAEVQINDAANTKLVTNEEGQLTFPDLEAGDYTYQINSLPESYSLAVEELTGDAVIGEGETTNISLQVQRALAPAAITFSVLDQNEEAVPGAVMVINETKVTTDANGQAAFAGIVPGDYQYTLESLPEGYHFVGSQSGALTFAEGETLELGIPVARDIQAGRILASVKDQNGEVVAGITLKVGEQSLTTDANGQVVFAELAPNNYSLQVIEAPANYEVSTSSYDVSVSEGADSELAIQVTRLTQGNLDILVTDNANKPIAGVKVEIADTVIETNAEGIAHFTALTEGEHEYKILSVPSGYSIDNLTGSATVVVNETRRVEVRGNASPESSESSASQVSESSESSQSSSNSSSNQASSNSMSTSDELEDESKDASQVEAEAAQATRQFVHADTGVQVWVNPADADRIVKLNVVEVKDNAALANTDHKAYRIELLDRNNLVVTLNYIAEVKLPSRPVTSQLRVVRVNNNNQLSNLAFSVHNQRVNIRTQQLGTFAIIYGAAKSQNSSQQTSSLNQKSVNVSMNSSIEKTANLPNTGESSMTVILVLAALALGAGAFILFKRPKKDYSDKEDKE